MNLSYFKRQAHIAPLAMFRIVFGAIMFLAMLRFMANGWVHSLYIEPDFFFKYQYFEWVQPLGNIGTYALFIGIAVSFLLISLGLFYRLATISAFMLFTYAELLDKTNYLNHYYFVSLMVFLLMFLPAHKGFSLDIKRKSSIKKMIVPKWNIDAIKLQLAMVYLFAGIAKLNYDWLFNAMPLKIWLSANTHLPIIGGLMDESFTAYFFSWGGALYDLAIVFLLINAKTRNFAFALIVFFHITTWLLFPIGMFPFIMIGSTFIFFSADFHLQIFNYFRKQKECVRALPTTDKLPLTSRATLLIFALYFLIQVAMPLRFMQYPGKLFWTEMGYRFSWRVMLMEKAGTAFFYVKDKTTGKEIEIDNKKYLTKNQDKMMATQADMMIDFAHYLKQHFAQMGMDDIAVRVESYVTLNGSGSRLFLDSSVNLLDIYKIEDQPNLILAFKE